MDSDPLAPESFRRRILLAVTGLSPQVVTETLYHLCCRRQPSFVPTEIHLVTTREGARHAELTLLHPHQGRFRRFLDDFGLQGRVSFAQADIHVLRGANGQALEDIRTEEDNTAAADTITALVRQFTRDADCALHVSLAGGRKTLGYYLGYALTLFGRAQDRLSHVLVSPPFESNHQFYYPPPVPEVLFTRDNRPINTDEAEITLAEIPFVSLRHGLPEHLLAGEASYMETVGAARRSFAPPRLLIDPARRLLRCGEQELRLPPQPFAWYAWMARRRKTVVEFGGHVCWRDDGIAEAFLREYRGVVGEMAHDYETARAVLRDGMTEEFFEQKKALVNRLLRQALGLAATPYLIVASGRRPTRRFGLLVPPEQIRLPPTEMAP
jgi:CRISPR-associated protein (TIGR02584 family)